MARLVALLVTCVAMEPANGFVSHHGHLPSQTQRFLSSKAIDVILQKDAREGRRKPTDTTDDTHNAAGIPKTMRDAVQTFFLTGDHGPLYVVISILMFSSWRIQMSSIGTIDALLFGATVLFWSFQEHFLHEKVLHSTTDWIGKDIHQGHHDKPYYHISIDSAPLLLGWMFTAHLAFRALLPLPLALTATVAYSLSGLFYEWAHYVVHTKVRFRSQFWKRVKENHLRHHVVSDKYWFAFSMPAMDDLFQTNPSVQQVKRAIEEDRRQKRIRRQETSS